MPNPNDIFILFSKITVMIMVIPIITAVINRKYLNKPLKIFLLYLIFALFFNLLEQFLVWYATKYIAVVRPYLDYWAIGDTSFLSILQYINDFVFLGLFYHIILGRNPYGKWVGWVSLMLLIACLTNYLFIEGYNVVGIFNPTADAIFIFSIAAFYLWHLYRTHLMLPLQKNPYFWISFGLIVPHVIGFFLSLVGDIASKEDFGLFVVMSVVRNCFLILAQVLFAIGFWQARYAQYLPLPGEEEGSASAENV
jgi:hypothetical protein